MSDPKAALERAKAAVGLEKIAAEFAITPQAVSQWEVVPPTRVLGVERATGISRHELRPDLYPLEPASQAAQ